MGSLCRQCNRLCAQHAAARSLLHEDHCSQIVALPSIGDGHDGFSGESASGWQTANLATPVALNAGTTYVVSYSTTDGRHAQSTSYFDTARTVGPLSAPASGNGRYRNLSAGYPSSTAPSATNYFIDIVYRVLS